MVVNLGSLVVRGVTRKFGTTWVLKGVDTKFEVGTITVVEGANGVGKTTLLSVVGGLLEPNSGAVRWEFGDFRVSDRRDLVGWVGHESACYRDLTAEENVQIAARVFGKPLGVVRPCLERVGATDFLARRVGLLSRGQRQRVALARAIVHLPRLLLLDEPFTGLDTVGTSLLESVLLDEQKRGVITILISHDTRLADRLGARRLLLAKGRIQVDSVSL
jgi:heme exporter protein A